APLSRHDRCDYTPSDPLIEDSTAPGSLDRESLAMGDKTKDPNRNPRLRNKGNPHARPDTRPATGRAEVPPAQAKSVPPLKTFGARYRLGAPARPASIVFDNGFLDKFAPREPTMSDYAALARWQAKLAAAETLRPDLVDACAAYRHFLFGGGVPRTFSYDKYVLNDRSGAITLANAMLDIQDGAEILWESTGLNQFEMTGDP